MDSQKDRKSNSGQCRPNPKNVLLASSKDQNWPKVWDLLTLGQLLLTSHPLTIPSLFVK